MNSTILRSTAFLSQLVLAAWTVPGLVGAAAPPTRMEQRIECPLWLKPDAMKAASPPDGWLVAIPQEWRLDGGGLLHGAPDEGGYLKPYDAKITKKGNVETGVSRWVLSPLPHAFETWAFCGYGPIQLFKRIPVDATECTATMTTERGAFTGTVIVCQ